MASTTEASHYFSSDPLPPSDPATIQLDLPDVSFTLTSDRGVFARDRVDVGSKLLLLSPPPSVPPKTADAQILDIGAGYGPIALTLAHRNPTAKVWAVEVNDRARNLCRKNAKVAEIDNLSVVEPDDVPSNMQFDQIWSNPPIRVGKKALHALLGRWLPQLSPEGHAYLVVQKHLGADSLQRWIETQGFETTRYRSQKAFRLLMVSQRSETNNLGTL